MSENQLVDQLLRASSPEALLATFAALTHRIHANAHDTASPAARAVVEADLRTQRDIVQVELVQRMTPDPSPVSEGDVALLEVGVHRADSEQALIEFTSMEGPFSVRVPQRELTRVRPGPG